MPFGFGFQQPAKEVLTRPFDCLCVCHPIMQRPRATHMDAHRCDECYEDSAKSLMDVLQSALDERAMLAGP